MTQLPEHQQEEFVRVRMSSSDIVDLLAFLQYRQTVLSVPTGDNDVKIEIEQEQTETKTPTSNSNENEKTFS